MILDNYDYLEDIEDDFEYAYFIAILMRADIKFSVELHNYWITEKKYRLNYTVYVSHK